MRTNVRVEIVPPVAFSYFPAWCFHEVRSAMCTHLGTLLASRA